MIIFKAFNVVFPGILATLDLDDLEETSFIGIFQAVKDLLRDIRALILLKEQHGGAVDNFSDAANHHPMLAPVTVPLQT